MAITSAQKALAEQQQANAAADQSEQVRLIAGPGTGKTATIIKRVCELLKAGVDPSHLYVISFTRATCAEIKSRIVKSCNDSPVEEAAKLVRVSTMHSLALSLLRRARLLEDRYPAEPALLDEWEQKNIYDNELSIHLRCTPTRAGEVRLAHDASWQTLNPEEIAQAQITSQERIGFNAFHSSRTNLYSCVLPGELIYKCVEGFRMGSIDKNQSPEIEHLIVDEFQDLNACDQEFVKFLTSSGSRLFIAGDDDQSIYHWRHANPAGIVHFDETYPGAQSHVLTDCFRCAPAILNAATSLIRHNPDRIEKNLVALLGSAEPSVQGRVFVWSFRNPQEEAAAIAASCRDLVGAGMKGHEDEILILLSNTGLQLDAITTELANLGLPFEPPRGESLTKDTGIRAVYSLLRISRENKAHDYVAYRNLLEVLEGAGSTTIRQITDGCVANHQNYHALHFLQQIPTWLNGRAATTIRRVSEAARIASAWSKEETLGQRFNEIESVLSDKIFTAEKMATVAELWIALAKSLPQEITFDELFNFLSAENEAAREVILLKVLERLGKTAISEIDRPRKIRILTMHGAKGLGGKVVFIPTCEQGVIPSFRAIQATGLLIEQRRLFYVSVTRAMAVCIFSHAGVHTGASAFQLKQRPNVRLTRSEFLNDMAIPSQTRNSGLSKLEVRSIMQDIQNI